MPHPAPLLQPTPDELAKLAALARAFNASDVKPAETKDPKPYKGRIHRRLSQETIKEIVRRYRAGESTPKLSEEYGIARSSMAALLKKEGVVLRGKSMTKESVDRAVALYSQGLTIRQVAERVGYSYGAVRSALRRERILSVVDRTGLH